MTRKPYGVWMLLESGPWCFDQHGTLAEALLTARTLRAVPSQQRRRIDDAWRWERVWIAAPPVARSRHPKPRPKSRGDRLSPTKETR
jgi:hypothetical protein